MSQSQKILEVLADGELHCLTKELFMKDDRARISGLRKKGYEFYSPRCDGRCGMQHGSAVVMRQIVGTPESRQTLKNAPNSVLSPKVDDNYIPTPLFNFHSHNYNH